VEEYIYKIACLAFLRDVMERCVLCDEDVAGEHGKLRGTIVRAKNLESKNEFLYVCSSCQRQEAWVEKAKVKGV
jgi:hypothetical protein